MQEVSYQREPPHIKQSGSDLVCHRRDENALRKYACQVFRHQPTAVRQLRYMPYSAL